MLGNAIGYIRLLNSGIVHANYNASLYLPKWDENLQLQKLCKELNLSEATREAAGHVELQINNLRETFSADRNYYKVQGDDDDEKLSKI